MVVVAQLLRECLMTKRSWVQIQKCAALFFSTFELNISFSNQYVRKQIPRVRHY